ncbi:MAG: radical SAM family heme chaperone HemW [Acidobacteriota bacterium]
MREPAGLYVHLPYCRSRCDYCSFVVTTDQSSRAAYLRALETEASLAVPDASGAAFDTIYLGGGTPSLMPPDDLARLLALLRERFRVLPGSEVTLEANPDDVTAELSERWVSAGVNRVSLGVQSLSDQELAAVGRRHDAQGARRALAALRASGVSLSGDLILGLPDQTAESFRRSAEELAGSGVEHVSVYLLETEKSKIIEADRRDRPERYLADDEQADLWLALGRALAGAGFSHYEISNWAVPGREARHNSKYWRRVPTLGLGISAHELWGERRRANVSALPAYFEGIARGERPVATDRPVDAREKAKERIVLGLRLSEGVETSEIEAFISHTDDSRLAADWQAWRETGILEGGDGRTRFTERGFLLSNEVLCRFV